MTVHAGRLVAVSGIDGSGKSTLLDGLAAVLRGRGHRVVTVAALKPAATSPLPWLKQIPVGPDSRGPVEQWIAGYFTLVLLDNAATVVRPALEAGAWVLADRWVLDHIANQGAFGVDLEPWRTLLPSVPRPDVHFLIDVPAGIAGERIARRSTDPGVGAGEAFLSRCARLMRSEASEATVTVLDGTAPPEDVLSAAVAALDLSTAAREAT
ncbi:dTMP kinase [Spirillospora sp. CA-142024]|uniref:dTMP kinase n=1 Tax=Spirillospora sp. CA-142024 TaxID=3240036 RepID=UPI003D934696